MRVIAFVNGRVGRDVVQYLSEHGGSEIVGLVLHPLGGRSEGEAILAAADLPQSRVLEAPALREEGAADRLRELEPNAGVSAFFGHILPPRVLEIFPEGCVNLHPAYLPYNRGTYPNVWSIVDRTPAGVSLHYMDEGVDTGPILARRRVTQEPWDTGETLYRRLQDACVQLFRDAWPAFYEGRLEAEPQDPDAGTRHVRADVEQIDPIDLDKTFRARTLIDRLRARTFPPHEGCYFEADGRRVYMRLHLWPEEEYPPEENRGASGGIAR